MAATRQLFSFRFQKDHLIDIEKESIKKYENIINDLSKRFDEEKKSKKDLLNTKNDLADMLSNLERQVSATAIQTTAFELEKKMDCFV